MSQDVNAFLGSDLSIIFLVIGILVGMGIERFRSEIWRQKWRARNGWRQKSWQWQSPPPPKLPDASDQLRIVMGADFGIQSILNKREARVFKELDVMVVGRNPGWQVMAQVSLGEILTCRNAEAYACINSKRVDLLLMDENCRPRHAIEYQGGGHHRGAAAARDAVKREALRRAGIGYHEVVAGQTTPSELRRLVEKLIPTAYGDEVTSQATKRPT